ncbi:MAG: nicotinamide riboside transporter PnuC [Chitinophagales bacterium]|nr:nicotinamide mononucleotide transporter [Bacteroidota bacterium]
MNDFFSSFFQGMYATSYWEWQAIICGILYLYFAIKGKVICWIFGFINAATYVYVCADAKLYLDAILQIFYVLMAIVGYLNWNKKDTTQIHIWNIKQHFFIIILTTIYSLILGFVFKKYTHQASPFLDAFATCFSLVTTYMVARKVLENWIYWIVIDSVLAYLYYTRGLEMSSVLMIIYTFMAIKGFLEWNKNYREQLALKV